MAVGILLAVAFSVIAAAWIDDWRIVPAGILAGLMASVEAMRTHDQQQDYTHGWEDRDALARRRQGG
ncbi:MAG TPA: hypothetical protein VGW38_10250 [Chloroflexota bacterium]|nr:hypothetical protein [Chloroflexota bacterium]